MKVYDTLSLPSLKCLMTIVDYPLQTFEDIDLFNLIGVICGLAIYNLTIVELHFPVALYKKLLKRKPTLDDLKELMPDVGRSDQGTVIWGSHLTCLWMSVSAFVSFSLDIFWTASKIKSFNVAAISPVFLVKDGISVVSVWENNIVKCVHLSPFKLGVCRCYWTTQKMILRKPSAWTLQ